MSYFGLKTTVGVILVRRLVNCPVTSPVAVRKAPNFVPIAGVVPPCQDVCRMPPREASPMIARTSLLVGEATSIRSFAWGYW